MSNCSVCSTAIPAGANRCPGCGAVQGEDNRCPHCHALAAVRVGKGGGYVCMACSKPRDPGPGTVIQQGGGGRGVPARAKSTGMRGLGIGLISVGVLAAIGAAAILPGAIGVVSALALGGLGIGLGAMSMRSGSRASVDAQSSEVRARELRIFKLAEQHQGRLTATDVARELHMSAQEADDALTAMCDGSRVNAEVTPQGIVEYVFRELRLQPKQASQVKVRVAEMGQGASAEPVDAEMADAMKEVEQFLDN